MVGRARRNAHWLLLVAVGVGLTLLSSSASALNQIPVPDPKPGSFGLAATKSQPPPTRGATISTPGNNASFSESPIRVSGICPNDLLVQIYNNDVMVGSVICKNGSFSLEVSLFAGLNELSAIVYDELGQAGPKSNIVRVRFTDTNFKAFGEQITLTSSYGRRSAPVNDVLRWPLQLSGGSGPYAFSIDWGDGSKPELKSQAVSGVVTIGHEYKQAGIYQVNITVTDSNDISAFLQVVAVSNGKVDGAAEGAAGDDKKAEPQAQVLWVPAAVSLAMLPPTFWLGRRSQMVSIRNKMLKDRDAYQTE